MDHGDAARGIIGDGLWRQNAGLVQLLGLCPVLAVSSSVVTHCYRKSYCFFVNMLIISKL